MTSLPGPGRQRDGFVCELAEKTRVRVEGGGLGRLPSVRIPSVKPATVWENWDGLVEMKDERLKERKGSGSVGSLELTAFRLCGLTLTLILGESIRVMCRLWKDDGSFGV